jgi:hypothetical protein
MTDDEGRSLLHRVWTQREVDVYPTLFGDLGPGVYPIPISVFTDAFRESPDPRWLHVGVFASPPNRTRDHALYVSSGLSNPWEDEVADTSTPSGLGVEYLFASRVSGDWAIEMMHRILAYDLLLSHERYPGQEPLNVGHRIPLGAPMVSGPASESAVTRVLVGATSSLPSGFTLDSGPVRFLQLIGITDAEAAYGREHGDEALIRLLREHDAYDITDPTRRSLV